MIEIKSLTKSFDSKVVIDELDLSFPSSGVISLLGPSGCGKSTLIKILAGILPFEKGSVSFFNDETISLAFQSPNLLSSLNVLDNVNIVRGNKKEDKEKASSLLKELGIDEVNKYPYELSGGMASRVNLARCLFKEADVYLLDEPFAALDESTTKKVIEVTKFEETTGNLVFTPLYNYITDDLDFYKERLHYYYTSYKTGENLLFQKGSPDLRRGASELRSQDTYRQTRSLQQDADKRWIERLSQQG